MIILILAIGLFIGLGIGIAFGDGMLDRAMRELDMYDDLEEDEGCEYIGRI